MHVTHQRLFFLSIFCFGNYGKLTQRLDKSWNFEDKTPRNLKIFGYYLFNPKWQN